MAGDIERFMSEDHARLDALLRRADRGDGTIDRDAYALFRRGLLRHIAMEEKQLLPFARAKRGEPLAIAKQLRADHGEIAAMLVPSPTPELCARLRAKLGEHNALEEGTDGLYARCDALAAGDAEIVERLRAQPEVPVAPHYDGPLVAKRLAR
jgi:hypothetical protein